MRPVPGYSYTFSDISRMDLDDIPFLKGTDPESGHRYVIQIGHVTDVELSSIEGFGALLWRYLYTTREWIPVFEAVDNAAVLPFVDIQPTVVTEWSLPDDDQLWVTPKGFPREQWQPSADV